MDNRSIAQLLGETADLLEIGAGDPFRIRSYRRAAEAIENSTEQVAGLPQKRLLEIPGIGKGMVANILEIEARGSLPLRDELLQKYRPTMLELLKLPGMGPKTVSLLWDAIQVSSVEDLASALEEGRLDGLPRIGPKQIEKMRRGIADYRKNSGRIRIDQADAAAERLTAYLLSFDGIDRVTPAGSFRRGKETSGDLDLLATGPACSGERTAAAVEYAAAYPPIADLIAKGQNKVSFRLREGLQVDVRLLPQECYGAALQYFTGSKTHNIALRQRALRLGYTLSEYSLAALDGGGVVASETEEEIYAALGMDWIPPELRESQGEIEAAMEHRLPVLVGLSDIRGDLHMHTDATDGKNTMEEMAEAAIQRGYEYIAITDHSKNLAMTNGLDDERALEHIGRIRAVDRKMKGRIRILAGIEVDILADGALDLSDHVLQQMDVVIASVHSYFQQSAEEMTARLLRALENPYVRILGHPTGRLLLRREAYEFDMEAVLRQAAKSGVAMEHNSYPDRLDLNDLHMRMAKTAGVKVVVNTDSHHVSHLANMPYGVKQLRRAWLTKEDLLNTLPVEELLEKLKRN